MKIYSGGRYCPKPQILNTNGIVLRMENSEEKESRYHGKVQFTSICTQGSGERERGGRNICRHSG